MNEIYTERAKRLVRQYIIKHLDKSDPSPKFEVYVVWFVYILGNWKAILASTLFDDMYYEVIYNDDGVKSETYLDAYKKFESVCIPDGANLNVDPEPTLPFKWPTDEHIQRAFDQADLIDHPNPRTMGDDQQIKL